MQVFSGNVNSHCARVIAFDPWIYAESIRVIPISWNTEVGLRFELLGCQEGVFQCQVNLYRYWQIWAGSA